MKKPLLTISILFIATLCFAQYLEEPQQQLQKPSVLVLEDIINLPEEKASEETEKPQKTEPVKEEKSPAAVQKNTKETQNIKQAPKEVKEPQPAAEQKSAQSRQEKLPAEPEHRHDYDWKHFILGSLYVLIIAAVVFLMSKYQ